MKGRRRFLGHMALSAGAMSLARGVTAGPAPGAGVRGAFIHQGHRAGHAVRVAIPG